MESIGNFDDLHFVSMATRATDGQVDLSHFGLTDFTRSLHLWPAEDLDLRTDFLLDVKDWN